MARAIRRQSASDSGRYLYHEIAEELAERLAFMRFVPQNALVLADPTGLVAQALLAIGVKRPAQLCRTWNYDEPLSDQGYDLIVDCGTLAQVNDLPGALILLREALAPNGLFVAAMIGAGSLPNLRRAMLASDPDRAVARMHPLIDNRSGSALLQRTGFARQVVDSRTLTVSYPSLDRLVSDLRDQALGNVLASPGPPLTPTSIARARQAFASNADAAGRIAERFELLFLTSWKT